MIGFCISYWNNKGEHKITNNITINKSKSEVFDFIADMRNELDWNPDVQFSTPWIYKSNLSYYYKSNGKTRKTKYDKPKKLY